MASEDAPRQQRWEDVGNFIREQRRLAELSLRRLADLAGVSNPYLSQIERGLRRPSAEILQQIARGLEISAETLYIRAGFLDPDPDTPDLRQSIRADRGLTETQKQSLVQVYESFLAQNGARAGRPGPSDVGGDDPGPSEAEPADDPDDGAAR